MMFIQKNKPWFCMFLVAISLLIRNYTAFQRPEFWAEDGTVFFKDAVERGFGSLFLSLGGYHNFISRVVAWLGTFFSFDYSPGIYAYFSVLLVGYMLSYVLLPSFSWLIPRYSYRVLTCFLFTAVPGVIESSQMLCGLHPVFGLFTFLFILKERKRFNIFTWIIWFLLLFSTPETTLLLPLLGLLFLNERKKEYLVFIISIIFLTLMNVLLSKLNETTDYGFKPLATFRGIQTGLERLSLYLFLIPIFGKKMGEKIFTLPGWLFWPISIVTFYYIRNIYIKYILETKKRIVLVGIVLGIILYFFLVILSRPYLWDDFNRSTHQIFWDSRYAFVAMSYSVLFWMVFIQSLPLKYHFIGKVFLVWFSLNLIFTVPKNLDRPDLQYRNLLSEIEQEVIKVRKGQRDSYISPPVYFQPNKMGSFTISIQP